MRQVSESENWERKFHDKMHPESLRVREDRFIKRAALRLAIRKLPPAQRDAVLYHDVLGFTIRECSAILSAPKSTIGDLLSEAKKALKINLGQK